MNTVQAMFELDRWTMDEKSLINCVIKEMFLAATLVKWMERFQPRTVL